MRGERGRSANSSPQQAEGAPSPERRAFLRQTAAVGLSLGGSLGLADACAQDDPREQRPTANDRLVIADGPSGERVPLKVDDILVDAKKPLSVFPYDAASGTVRDGSRLNRLLLVRLAEGADQGQESKGVVAFSAVCTHEACSVSEWIPSEHCLLCPCHFSKFDVRDGGNVIEGPAPRSLPRVPLRVEHDDVLVVDGGFSAQPGVRRTV
ncbi:MAG: ubiquinol-cytochrome c reductase iron-sulfur subunit [Panacagrimonas sp.]